MTNADLDYLLKEADTQNMEPMQRMALEQAIKKERKGTSSIKIQKGDQKKPKISVG